MAINSDVLGDSRAADTVTTELSWSIAALDTLTEAGTRARSTGDAAAKRAFDIVVGGLLAAVVLPVVLALAAVLAASFRANPFFVHERIGRGGEPFKVPKLRTLPPSTPAYADKYEVRETQTTALGAWLRRLHLDELPQLLLVPLGRMSLVGPRPEMAHLYDRMPERQAGTRIRSRPGCTGLWQVSRGYDQLIWEGPEYDIYYADFRTLRLDVWIMWRTLVTIAGLAEPVTLRDVPRWTWSREASAHFDEGNQVVVSIDRRERGRARTPGWTEPIVIAADRIGQAQRGRRDAEVA